MLHHRYPVHRPQEQRDKDHPVMERRAESERGNTEDHGASGRELHQLLHEAFLP